MLHRAIRRDHNIPVAMLPEMFEAHVPCQTGGATVAFNAIAST
jgi:hypothetical protein